MYLHGTAGLGDPSKPEMAAEKLVLVFDDGGGSNENCSSEKMDGSGLTSQVFFAFWLEHSQTIN